MPNKKYPIYHVIIKTDDGVLWVNTVLIIFDKLLPRYGIKKLKKVCQVIKKYSIMWRMGI